ncbi:MAG TPA: glutamate--tRNA ligase family protein [Polyangia bacterium]
MSVRTRFAPSPTGFLHIGGVRTALFNYLFAKKLGGKYVLRVDDTDQQRNVDAALAPILHGFQWLDLKWDEGPLFQSKRTAEYQAAVDALVARGAAYYDSTPAAEIEVERKKCELEKRPFVHARKNMSSTKVDGAVVRLKVPREGTLVLHDLVRGDVEFQWAQEADHVIQRADGSFIYHLANVVDDKDYGITHVIRAEEHLSNTPRQVFMVQALGYPLPAYAHLPYVAEPGSKRKLSKRKLDQYLKNPDFKKVHDHGTQIASAMKLSVAAETFNPVIVDFYEQVGYLPDAIVNYLLLLGWSLDDKTEWFTRDEMVRDFSLERVQKAPASFDPAKLQAFQTHYMQQVPLDEKVERVRPFVERAGITVDGAKLGRIVAALGDRIKVFGDILLQGAYFFGDDVPSWDDKAFAKRVLAPGAVDKLASYRDWLDARGDDAFDAPTLEQATAAWLGERGWALGDIVHAVRVAVTGVGGGPGLFDCLALLGRKICVRRIDAALAKARV